MKKSQVLDILADVDTVVVQEATTTVAKFGPEVTQVIPQLALGDWVEYNNVLGEKPTFRKTTPEGIIDLTAAPISPVVAVVVARVYSKLGAHPEQEIGILQGHTLEFEYADGSTSLFHTEIFRDRALQVANLSGAELGIPVREVVAMVEYKPDQIVPEFVPSNLPMRREGYPTTFSSGRQLPI